MKNYLYILSVLSIATQAQAFQPKPDHPTIKCSVEKYLKMCMSNTGSKKPITDIEVEIAGLDKSNISVSRKGTFAMLKFAGADFSKNSNGYLNLVYEDGTRQKVNVTFSNADNVAKANSVVKDLHKGLTELQKTIPTK